MTLCLSTWFFALTVPHPHPLKNCCHSSCHPKTIESKRILFEKVFIIGLRNFIHSHLEPLTLLRDLLLKIVIWTYLEQLEQSIAMPRTFFELTSSAHFAKSVAKPEIQTNTTNMTNAFAKWEQQNPKPNLRPNQFALPCWRNVPTFPFVESKYPSKFSNSSTHFTPSSSVAG